MSQRLVAVFTPFEDLTDPRVERSRQHELFDLVVVALCATLAGSDTWADIERFGKARIEWLRTFLRLENGIPSHDTFGRVFSRLNPAGLLARIQQWLDDIGLEVGKHIAIDGKTLRGSFDKAASNNPLHLVSAWAAEARLTLGQVATDAKSNEITAIPELLQLLAIKGCIVTIDAMGCQTAIARQIQAQGGDYLLALKSNHKKASAAVKRYFHQHIEHHLAWRTAENFFDAFDDSHGRTVRRRVWTITDLFPLPELTKWPGLQSVIVVETIRMAHQQAPVTSDYRVYISSLVRSATAFASMIRQHWDIENKLHWSLDVTFNEDHCRIRKEHAAENMAAVRHVALNLLRQEHSQQISLRQKRLLCGLDEHYLLMVLSRAT